MTYPIFLSPFIINPSIPIRWYGFMYIVGIVCSIFILKYAEKKKWIVFNYIKNKKGEKEGGAVDMVFYTAVIGISGARLGYFLLYDPLGFLTPWEIFGIYFNNGIKFSGFSGMSIHGGIIGGYIGLMVFAKKYKYKFYDVLDIATLLISCSIFFGRIGNFLNAELYGRVTDSIFGMRFPLYDMVGGYEKWIGLLPALRPYTEPRHPSQLYEAFLEGIVSIVILYILTKNRDKLRPGTRTWVWFILYGLFRTLVEGVREVSEWTVGPLTSGMIYSIAMIILGTVMLIHIYSKKEDVKYKK